jgi:branched-chain amino acid transport system permease protein
VTVERGSRGHRVVQVVGVAGVVLCVLAILAMPDYRITLVTNAVVFALAILGLNVVMGFTGQISIGHSAFMGIGAYASAILVSDHGWPFLLTLPVAAILGFAVGFAFGIPALRIRGLYLALVTLALAFAFPAIVTKFPGLTGGANGKTMQIHWRPPAWMPGSESQSAWIFLTVLVVTALGFLAVSSLRRSRVGRGLEALRDNEIGAAVSGVPTARYKVLAFATSASLAAVSGSLFVLNIGAVSDQTFGLLRSIDLITGLVIGGVGAIGGAVLGGFAIQFIPYYASSWLADVRSNILYGVLLLAIVYAMPSGVAAAITNLRERVIQIAPWPPTSPQQQSTSPIPETTPAASADAAPIT